MTIQLQDTLDLQPGVDSSEGVAAIVQKALGNSSPVSVKELKGGITNQLLIAEQDGVKVLVRAFGKGTGEFIDREREYVVHEQLQLLGLAPKLYANFTNGLVYGYVDGHPSKPEELTELPVIKQVARRLAQWHAMLKPATVSAHLSKPLTAFWDVLAQWVELCPEGVLQVSRAELRAEFDAVRNKIGSGHEVMGHCDLLSANILLPENHQPPTLPRVPVGTPSDIADKVASDVAFIDYEYSMPCPRAFDIANHFWEWQGFECEASRVPRPTAGSEKLRAWCTEYLTAYGLLTATEQSFDGGLLQELQAFWGMPGFYWGIWSAMQSQISDIDFDYSEYAKKRFQEFLDWKAAYTG